MKLADMAMKLPDYDEEAGGEEDDGKSAFADAAIEAFELFQKGDKEGAATALKAAVEACVADYMADDDEEEPSEEA